MDPYFCFVQKLIKLLFCNYKMKQQQGKNTTKMSYNRYAPSCPPQKTNYQNVPIASQSFTQKSLG